MSTNAQTPIGDQATEKMSLLWVVVMFNITFADIVGFVHPGALEQLMRGDVGFEVTHRLLLVFSMLLEIPIAMIFLSRILEPRLNRWANVIAVVMTTLFVIGGGSNTLSYMFFAAIEIAAMVAILRYAWQIPEKTVRTDHVTV